MKLYTKFHRNSPSIPVHMISSLRLQLMPFA